MSNVIDMLAENFLTNLSHQYRRKFLTFRSLNNFNHVAQKKNYKNLKQKYS